MYSRAGISCHKWRWISNVPWFNLGLVRRPYSISLPSHDWILPNRLIYFRFLFNIEAAVNLKWWFIEASWRVSHADIMPVLKQAHSSGQAEKWAPLRWIIAESTSQKERWMTESCCTSELGVRFWPLGPKLLNCSENHHGRLSLFFGRWCGRGGNCAHLEHRG